MIRTAVVIGLVACAFGCSPVDVEEESWAVWSDDQTELLIARTRYDSRGGYLERDFSNYRFDLWRYDVATREATRVLGWSDGQPASGFLMRSLGFILLTRTRDPNDDGMAPFERWTERIPLDGGGETVRADDLIWPTPSPDGTLIADAARRCTRPSMTEMRCETGARFFRGDTFEELPPAEPMVTTHDPDEDSVTHTQWLWAPEPRLVVQLAIPGLVTSPTMVLQSGAPPVETDPLACPDVRSRTSSGPVAMDGRTATVGLFENHPRVEIHPGVGPGWPTECFP